MPGEGPAGGRDAADIWRTQRLAIPTGTSAVTWGREPSRISAMRPETARCLRVAVGHRSAFHGATPYQRGFGLPHPQGGDLQPPIRTYRRRGRVARSPDDGPMRGRIIPRQQGAQAARRSLLRPSIAPATAPWEAPIPTLSRPRDGADAVLAGAAPSPTSSKLGAGGPPLVATGPPPDIPARGGKMRHLATYRAVRLHPARGPLVDIESLAGAPGSLSTNPLPSRRPLPANLSPRVGPSVP